MDRALFERLPEILSRANGKRRERTLDQDQAAKLIALAESNVKELPCEIRAKVVFEYVDGVPNSYKWRAAATKLVVRFDQSGDAVDAAATTASAARRAYGKNIRRLSMTDTNLVNSHGFTRGFMQV